MTNLPKEEESDVEEQLLTPTGDIPSFIGGTIQAEGSTKTSAKGKHVVYEDGVLSEVT